MKRLLPDPQPPVANPDKIRSTFSDSHSGQTTSLSASLKRRSNSKILPQSWHWYSYNGILLWKKMHFGQRSDNRRTGWQASAQRTGCAPCQRVILNLFTGAVNRACPTGTWRVAARFPDSRVAIDDPGDVVALCLLP